ncbi:hypothetical protein GE253_00620 [Niveispirillum sp. SYP-B3756]|uniref:hypothetical protein n=1 Tax=Niveispirillum sp. SYP-B3756 TaxID=2662178 RepID=UPI001292714F|nr:hypothetical protein [Niveispirillum sp. SYP-B3756]MQP63838.1 hypothetical protein [Niveispirillum sp. SYP-B3756]
MSETADQIQIHIPSSEELRQRTEEARERARRARHHAENEEARRAALEAERKRRLGPAEIRHRLTGLEEVVERGEYQLMLERFPSDLCVDRGRAINNNEETWPATLAGVALQLYLFWQAELRDLGYGITARILEFPDDIPGDAGLFLTWQ